MSRSLCFRCSREQGYSTSAEVELLLNTEYQANKFIKHTRPERIYLVNSVFNDPSTGAYAEFIINTSTGGSVFVDDEGRSSFTWFAGKDVGMTYRNGNLLGPANAIKLVLPFDAEKIHAYPFIPNNSDMSICDYCGTPIIK